MPPAAPRQWQRAATRPSPRGAGGAAELPDLKPSTLSWRIEKLGLRAELARVRARKASA